jgi:hypothetical protein
MPSGLNYFHAEAQLHVMALLAPSAAVKHRAGTGHRRARVGKVRDEMSFHPIGW